MLTERPPNEPPSERLRPDAVIDYLHRFPKAVITYLEYLVFQRKLEVLFISLKQINYVANKQGGHVFCNLMFMLLIKTE